VSLPPLGTDYDIGREDLADAPGPRCSGARGPAPPSHVCHHRDIAVTWRFMKMFNILLGLLILAITPAQAQCKDCGCKDKCTPSCKCTHGEKPKAR
jgi:hypothetical protein